MRFSVADDVPTPRSLAVRACYNGHHNLLLSLENTSSRRRLRPPDCGDSSALFDDEIDDENVENKWPATGLFQGNCAASVALETVHWTDTSRQEFVKQLERACERRAVQKVAGSDAYQTLCQTLQQARQDADVALERLLIGQNKRDEQELEVLRHEQLQLEEGRARTKLQQVGDGGALFFYVVVGSGEREKHG
uniref:Uncharacterized protein n=1 Tax=Hyaloperonospora arabidopsidis (strain Emoy2) TaxID=559515 RepID=M4BSI4_HYAAE